MNKNLTVTAVTGGTVNLTKSIANAAGTNTVNITGAGTSNVVLNNGTTSDQFAPTTISVNSGKLSLGASNQIGNSTGLIVNGGGTFNTGGFSEGTAPTGGIGTGAAGAGALTLAANSTIDFTSAAGGSNLVFNSLSSFVSGTALTIAHWTGSARSDGSDRLLFVNNPNLSETDLANVQFTNDAGTAFALGATEIAFNGYTEIVPVPEPSTWISGALVVALLGWSPLKKLRQLRVPSLS